VSVNSHVITSKHKRIRNRTYKIYLKSFQKKNGKYIKKSLIMSMSIKKFKNMESNLKIPKLYLLNSFSKDVQKKTRNP